MQPRIVAIEGPLTGSVFELSEEDLPIGRGQSNKVVLTDAAVSRQHCVIRFVDGVHRIIDLDSTHGIRVNQAAVQDHVLAHGDRIQVGLSAFVFMAAGREAEPAESRIEVSDASLSSARTTHLKLTDALYLQPQKLLSSLSTSERTRRDLNAFLEIGKAIVSMRGVEPLGRRLLDLLMETVPAERAAVLLARAGSTEFDVVVTASRRDLAGVPLKVSRTVTEQVLRERLGIWSNNVLEDERLCKAPSLMTRRIRSVLCVPLAQFDRTLGAVYLDTGDSDRPFDEGHLHLVTAIAAVASGPLSNAQEIERLERENQRLNAEVNLEHSLIGESQPLRDVYRFIGRIAPTDSTVLIRGESGTGKELAARAIHANGPRANRPFIAVNCAALMESLLESELFGHEKGAFTGALAQKMGRFELADEGTLFLDEIGEMPPALQVKLLRVLQEREFERVGGTRPIRIDIRLIAATNRDLEAAIREGKFRQDLYYRLNVVSLAMPPLRDCREDIPLLATHFCSVYSSRFKKRVLGISPDARDCLQNYDWPGNVRELQNAIERAVVMALDDVIRPEDLPDAVVESKAAATTPSGGYHETVNAAKREIIRRAIEDAKGTVTQAARSLALNPNYLHRLMKNLGLRGE